MVLVGLLASSGLDGSLSRDLPSRSVERIFALSKRDFSKMFF